MSKSKGNVINLADTADETAARIRGARTDSERRITFDPEARPEVANLLRLAALLRETSPEEVAEQVGDGGARPQGGGDRGRQRDPRRPPGPPR